MGSLYKQLYFILGGILMAEENKVIDVEKVEETGMSTTQPAAPEETKTDVIGKVKTGAKIVGTVALGVIAFCAGLAKGKSKSAAKSSNEDNVVDAEPTSEEDEVSE
jgi:uncharacterized protein HemX